MSDLRRIEDTMPDLVRRARAGDAGAREGLLRLCHRSVYRWALVQTGDADDADDVAQEVLVRVDRSLDGFGGRARFATWLYQVTRNAAFDWRRRVRSRLRAARDAAAESRAADEREDPVERLHAAGVSDVITELFRRLPARQREVFNLADMEGVALVEIAERLGLDPGTVRAHLFRARRTLRLQILAQHPELAEGRR